ncbi:DUF1188 domain-containing protein [Methanococcus voltae]|uniref:DUF1188 domain-containing protein n=1 Tax=Methanococcus voltae (strain ATCC BAA-1334 / A3) TaxID=456320 RepID=D7DUD4_METV3|nr:DUF1188 domain-containing protein [Methanococcus voltae]MCS3900544.1 hypothetical protein [Methanococcus voltae]
MKYGITENVKTIESKVKVRDIIKKIAEKKANAIKYYLEGEEFEQAIIFGAYLSGNYIANTLKADCGEVILIDSQPHLEDIVTGNGIKFMDLNTFMLKLRNNKDKEINPDLIIDVTGLGGVDPNMLKDFDPKVLIIEDPKSSFDKELMEADNTHKRLCVGHKKGSLKTFRSSKISKTSGTMTLTVDVIMDSCIEIKELDGVLYSVPNLEYFEGIVFHEKDVRKFLREVNTPALTVSCLGNLEAEIDEIIDKNMQKVYSFVKLVK